MSRIINILCFIVLFQSCNKDGSVSSTASKVELKQINGTFTFFVNNARFDLKGIGFNFEYRADFENLKRTGANAIRTWSTRYADTILKASAENEIMVAMGINIGKELYGFNYNNKEAVEKQFIKVKGIVNKYKDHPNLLCWVIGNEINLLFEEDGATLKMVNPNVYKAVSEITNYIHKVDPNHPVTTTFAGINKEHIEVALEFVPQIDIVSVQVYADLLNLEEKMSDLGISKPYMVTEFGPMGHWETPKTDWGREIEEPSGPKADGIKNRMNQGLINNNSKFCLGGFAFVWGNKHERTPTWYGMHHEDGYQTEIIDNLTKIYSGSYPENLAPRVDSLLLNEKRAVDQVYLQPGVRYTSKVYASDPNGDELQYRWEIAKEVGRRSQGGEKESKPERINVEIINSTRGEFTFITPKEKGDYRVLVYVSDGRNKAGNANVPFYIKK